MDCDITICNAKCCYNPPIPRRFLIDYKDKIATKIIGVRYLGNSPFGRNNIVPLTHNDKCPFLNKNNRCNIYKQRPEICRVFGEKIECKL